MFIISKRNYRVKRVDGTFYSINKDFIGVIPDDVAESNLVQRAIRGGMICVPSGTKDRELEQSDAEAAKSAAEHDVRPDAAGQTDEKEEETKKPKGKSAKE